MIQQIKNRLQREDKGFTLIELMVVVLIIAILIAIAIPTFLGARGRAQDRAAQSSLRNTVTGAKAIYTDDEDYADADTTALAASEPSLTFVGAAVDSDDSNEISVMPGTSPSTRFVAATWSNNKKCWYIQDSVAPGTNPGTKFAVDVAPAGNNCQADAAPAVGSASWVANAGDAVDF
jgi:type IV pilus assembly protein PilA